MTASSLPGPAQIPEVHLSTAVQVGWTVLSPSVRVLCSSLEQSQVPSASMACFFTSLGRLVLGIGVW